MIQEWNQICEMRDSHALYQGLDFSRAAKGWREIGLQRVCENFNRERWTSPARDG